MGIRVFNTTLLTDVWSVGKEMRLCSVYFNL